MFNIFFNTLCLHPLCLWQCWAKQFSRYHNSQLFFFCTSFILRNRHPIKIYKKISQIKTILEECDFFVIKINMTLLWREVGAQVLKASQSHQIWLADGSQSLSEVNSISTRDGCLPCRNVNYSWAVTFSKLQWDASSKTCCSSMLSLYKPALLTVIMIKNEA